MLSRARTSWPAGRIVPLTVAIVLAVAADMRPAAAQELDTAVTIAAGSGLSFGRGESGAVAKVSPVVIDVDVGLIFDGDTDYEWTPSLFIELGNQVSVGVNPSVKRVVRVGPLGVYGTLGFPFIFAPFTLIGVEPGAGIMFGLLSRFALVAELHVDVFFAGSDLPDDSILVKTDLTVGVRFVF